MLNVFYSSRDAPARALEQWPCIGPGGEAPPPMVVWGLQRLFVDVNPGHVD